MRAGGEMPMLSSCHPCIRGISTAATLARPTGPSMAAELSVDVPRTSSGPAVARSVLAARFGGGLSPQQLADVSMVVSELTTNALLYGIGQIRLRVAVEDDRVYGEVFDEGTGFATELAERDLGEVGGQGLLIVAALADRWGVHEGSSHIWFEIGRGGDREPVEPEVGPEERPPELD